MYQPYEQYRRVQTETASSAELVVLLYQGAVRFLNRAAIAIDGRNLPAAHANLVRAQEIITELRSTLSPRGGQMSERLRQLYTFMLGRLTEANFSKRRAPIDEVLGLLQPLLNAWQEVVRRMRSREAVMAGPAA